MDGKNLWDTGHDLLMRLEITMIQQRSDYVILLGSHSIQIITRRYMTYDTNGSRTRAVDTLPDRCTKQACKRTTATIQCVTQHSTPNRDIEWGSRWTTLLVDCWDSQPSVRRRNPQKAVTIIDRNDKNIKEGQCDKDQTSSTKQDWGDEAPQPKISEGIIFTRGAYKQKARTLKLSTREKIVAKYKTDRWWIEAAKPFGHLSSQY